MQSRVDKVTEDVCEVEEVLFWPIMRGFGKILAEGSTSSGFADWARITVSFENGN